MKNIFKRINLQLFGEGAGASAGGEGSPTGDVGTTGAAVGESVGAATAAAVDDEQHLRALGVPEELLSKRAKRNAKNGKRVNAQTPVADPQNVDAQTNTEVKESVEPQHRLSWDEIMADPEYNEEMQKVVQKRVKSSKEAQGKLDKLSPALELIAGRYGIDPSDVDALVEAINGDDSYYEERAMELGVSVDTARQLAKMEREQANAAKAEEEQKFQAHFDGLMRQAEAMKATYPNFNLQEEMNNPVFVRLTAPGVNVPVETAYYVVHKDEIQAASMQVAAHKAAEKVASSVAANQRRPVENGSNSNASSVGFTHYKNFTDAQKKEIRDRVKAGETVYLNQYG